MTVDEYMKLMSKYNDVYQDKPADSVPFVAAQRGPQQAPQGSASGSFLAGFYASRPQYARFNPQNTGIGSSGSNMGEGDANNTGSAPSNPEQGKANMEAINNFAATPLGSIVLGAIPGAQTAFSAINSLNGFFGSFNAAPNPGENDSGFMGPPGSAANAGADGGVSAGTGAGNSSDGGQSGGVGGFL